MSNNLIQHLRKIDPSVRIPEDLELELHRMLRQDVVTKKEHLLEMNEICSRVWFIEKGLFRSFRINKGQEENVWFMRETDVMFSPQSFYRSAPSKHVIEALENGVVYSISKHQMEDLFKRYHDFEHIGLLLTNHYYLKSLDNFEECASGTVKDRYNHFLQAYPGLGKRIPAKHIASFLKCSVRSLYRVQSKK